MKSLRIIGADILLLVAGVLLLFGATAGLILLRGPAVVTEETSPTGVFSVRFPLSSGDLALREIPSYQQGNAEIPVNAANVTKLTFSFTCRDTAPSQANYQITVTVDGPNGTHATESATCGQPVSLEFIISSPPQDGTVAGDTEGEARENLATQPNATKAMGAWRVSWQGTRQTLPIQPPAAIPSGSVKLTAEQWRTVLSPQAK